MSDAGRDAVPAGRWEQDLETLVRTRGAALVGYAYLLCGDRREAEDLVQDALVRTFARGRAGPAPGSAEAYVRSTVLNSYLDGFRRRRRWAAVRHLVATRDTTRAAHDGPTAVRLDLQTALGGLAPRERACVVLRFYEDLTVPAIADRLSLSQGAVKRYLSDATRRLEALLPGHGPDDAHPTTRDELEIELVEDRRSR